MKNTILIALTLIFSSCATTPSLTSEQNSVRILRGSYTLSGCTMVGALREFVPMNWDPKSGGTDHSGRVFKIAAAKMGANTVVVTRDGTVNETVYGNAYNCK